MDYTPIRVTDDPLIDISRVADLLLDLAAKLSRDCLELSWTLLQHYRRESGGTMLFAR